MVEKDRENASLKFQTVRKVKKKEEDETGKAKEKQRKVEKRYRKITLLASRLYNCERLCLHMPPVSSALKASLY